MLAKKQARRERALNRLQETEKQLNAFIKVRKGNKGPDGKPYDLVVEHKTLDRIKKEMSSLEDRLAGREKPKPKTTEGAPIQDKERWFIDIHAIHMAYVKNSERRKNKGKSRKKLKKVRNTSFVKSVVAQPGMIQAYREGRMGISPKTHSFRMRKEEPNYFT